MSPEKSSQIAWIAVDWGTSNLRAWALDDQDAVMAHSNSGQGMGKLAAGEFESALLAVIGPWLTQHSQIPVVAAGMVGARQGWVEVPYRAVPCSPVTTGELQAAPCVDARLQVQIVAGLSQADPADVMRGEETQLAGLLQSKPAFDGWICLPGTHSKWVRLANGIVHHFSTWMTGELFAVLSRQSVLRYSVGNAAVDMTVFSDELAALINEPDPLGKLFSVRAADLLAQLGPARCSARLSAILISTELRAMQRVVGDQPIVLAGAGQLAVLYTTALQRLGMHADVVDATALTLAGLTGARAISTGQQRGSEC